MTDRRGGGGRNVTQPPDVDVDLFEDAPCGYLLTDRTGLVTAANAEFLRLVGLDHDELVGRRTLASLLPVGARIYLETHLLPVIAYDGSVREVSLDLVRPDGVRVPVLLNAATIDRSAGSADLSLRAVFFETRDRHRYEQDLLAATAAAEQARLEATRLAQTLQQTLIPPAPPAIPHLSVAATYRPAGDGTTVGGDFYDFFEIDAASWMIVLGDVSGKGVEAAVVTSFVRYTVRALTVGLRDPAAILRSLDRALHAHETTRYCTLVLANLTRDDDGWTIRLSLAGHPPALLRDPDGRVVELGAFGSPVGLLDDPEFHTVEHRLGAETVTLYTDGVTEARYRRRLYGDLRLGDLLASLPPGPAEITEGIADAVLAYQHGDASDDIAIVSFGALP
ncbi:PAS domain S-box-containing protein [Nocardioides terrae]|uniref:PAS domain S-box-containing protein n=1 Tax=Nocardioides terrae TaxID=574651 RepID=A0A1I1L5N8_9ACTN|nr:SpoIIE family protein phosphatase [Nocardioides terrae]SFC68321.1 PAS domain S-box-containing protein [Nocardioides terrae]